MDAAQLARYLREQDDWTGRTPKEVRAALEWGIWKQCYANLSEAEWRQVLPKYANEIDFAMYAMCSVQFAFDRPELSLREINEYYEDRPLNRDAKRNFFVGYMNPYWYAYIHDVEYAKLRELIINSADVSFNYLVDYFLTTIVYIDLMMENPGLQFEYHQVPDISVSRVQALEGSRDQIISALVDKDMPALFKQLFYVMTHFAGSTYRGVHKGLMVELYGYEDLAEVRQIFNTNVEKLIENRGGVELGRVNPW